MKMEFVRTENARRFATAIELRERRGASESGMVVVHGRAGEGKTRTLLNWAASRQALMLTAYPGLTPRRAMDRLAGELRIAVRGDWEGAVAAAIAAAETPIVLDEAGFALEHNAACIERLRHITDKAGTLLVMVFMERDMVRLRQFDQITSRATLCAFHPNSEADVAQACAQLCEVQIEPELAARIWRESAGRMRLVLDAVSLVEHWARGAGKTRVSATDVAQLALCQDFHAAASAAAARARGAAMKLVKARA